MVSKFEWKEGDIKVKRGGSVSGGGKFKWGAADVDVKDPGEDDLKLPEEKHIVYLDSNFEPTDPQSATLIKEIEGGKVSFRRPGEDLQPERAQQKAVDAFHKPMYNGWLLIPAMTEDEMEEAARITPAMRPHLNQRAGRRLNALMEAFRR